MEYTRDPYLRSKYEQGVDAKIVIMGNTGQFSFLLPLATTFDRGRRLHKIITRLLRLDI